MERIIDVAQYIFSEYKRVAGEIIDEMKLQKLLYFSQRETFAILNKPLFAEVFEGWKYGPVSREVRTVFTEDGMNADIEEIKSESKYIINNIIHEYGALASWKLSALTHREISWLNSRKGLKKEKWRYPRRCKKSKTLRLCMGYVLWWIWRLWSGGLMVGKIVRCLTQYYDARLQRISIKSRPALVLKSPENDDYVVLPISTIPNRINVNPTYDIEIDPAKFSKINLTRISYIRTHRMVSIPIQQIDSSIIIGDLKSDYEELFLRIVEKVEQFHNEIMEGLLE